MRVLFAANTPPDPNKGAPGCDLATIDALRALGHEIDEIWAEDMPKRIRHGNLHQLLELPRNFARAVEERCERVVYDVIQVNQRHAWFAAREHQRLGRPGIFVNRSHGWEPRVRNDLMRYASDSDQRNFLKRASSDFLLRFLARHNELVTRYSDGIVVCSVDDREWILTHDSIDQGRVLALAPGIPDTFVTHEPPPMTADRARRILYSGQFAPFKAPKIVAAAANDALRSRPDTTMTWVCDRTHFDAIRALLAPDIQNRVTLAPWMPRDELRAIYDNHGIFLQPSYSEGFSQAFLEAMSRGMCVLATRIDGMAQTIRDGENGFLFERGDSAGIAERIRLLLDDPARCVAVSHAARAKAIGFTWKRTAVELIGFYQRLIAMKRSNNSNTIS